MGAGSEPLGLSDGGIRVPTPQLHFSETWDSCKSLPSLSSTTHSGSKRPHSCHHSEMQRQTLKIEPYMSPTTWEVSPSPGMTSSVHVAPPIAPSSAPSIKGLSLKSIIGSQTYTHTPMPSQSAEPAGVGHPPVMYNAWTTAKPGASNTRHTALTSSRLMTKWVISNYKEHLTISWLYIHVYMTSCIVKSRFIKQAWSYNYIMCTYTCTTQKHATNIIVCNIVHSA